MKREEFDKLQTGDVIVPITGDDPTQAYIVMANYGGRVTAVRTVDMTNPDEWGLVMKATYSIK